MKRFVLNTSVFVFLAIAAIGMNVVLTHLVARQLFEYAVPENKNILFVGDSHIMCAINDSIFENATNLGQNGAGMLYSYLKTKAVVEHNANVDTVVLGYGYDNLNREKWYSGERSIRTKLHDYFIFLNFSDYWRLLCANPLAVLKASPKTILHNLKRAKKGYDGLGRYAYLDRNMVDETRAFFQYDELEENLSINEVHYLKEIYRLCEEHSVQLILLNIPIHSFKSEVMTPYKRAYCDFAVRHLPKAILIDHADFTLPQEAYGDISHLNFRGAKIFSEFLREDHFKSSTSICR